MSACEAKFSSLKVLATTIATRNTVQIAHFASSPSTKHSGDETCDYTVYESILDAGLVVADELDFRARALLLCYSTITYYFQKTI